MDFQPEKEADVNNGLEFNKHVCLQCKLCIEGLVQYVAHIKNGCTTKDEDEYVQLEDLKKKEHHMKKELSTLKRNVVEKEGQLKDVQSKILRQERTGHKVKTAQLKVKAEELAYSKSEMKQLKLKYNKLLCFLRDKEQVGDQTEKKGDTPEKNNDQKSPKKRETHLCSSKVTTVNFLDKNSSPEKQKNKSKEKIYSKNFQNNTCNKSKVLKEQMNVMDSESNFTESSSKKLACSETVGINLKETSVISINPKHSKTNENESIKDNKRTVSIKKGKSTSSKPEKFSLEPMPDYNIETDQSHVTKDEVSTFSASTAEDKQNVACKATYSLDLYRTTSKSSNDTENEPSMITDKQNVAFKAKDSLDYYRNKASNVKKIEFQSSFQVKGKLDIVKTNAQPVKSILKSKIDLSKEPESLESLIDRRIKVEIVEQKPKTFTNDSDNTNESVVFIKQLQLPPKNEIDMNPRVSTPICKEEKLDFVDPELSAIISEEEIAPEVDESVLILNTNSSEVPKDTESLTAYKKAPLKDSIIPNDSNNSIHLNISLDSNIKAQAKDESHNEAMILETDLDQCLDNKKDTSIYSPQDKMETLSVSEGNFLTLSEASRSPTITELSATPNLDDIGVKDKGLVDIFSKKGDITHISESDNVRKDYASEETTKTFSDSIQLSEDLHASKKIKISMNKKSENIMEKPPTATVKPLNSESSTSSKLDNEASRTDKRKLLPESMENREKRTRINAPNLKDGSRQFSNYRRGGSNSATYSGQGSRFRPNYDSNHYPRSGVPPAAYQQPYRQPWHPRTTDNYRPRMHNQHPYNWNYQW